MPMTTVFPSLASAAAEKASAPASARQHAFTIFDLISHLPISLFVLDPAAGPRA